MSPLFTDITFSDEAWLEYLDWQATDKRVTKKINGLIMDIKRNGVLHGTGKPEQLKHCKIPPSAATLMKPIVLYTPPMKTTKV